MGFQVAPVVKNPLPIQDTQGMWVWSLGWEDTLEEETEVHFSILAWRSPWTERHVGYSPWDRKELDMTEET